MRQALCLRRGSVLARERDGPVAEVTVEVGGERRPALSYAGMTGPIEAGDEVIVNVQARDLGLGSGGRDVVHVNLTRGLAGTGVPGAHVMKLNYSSLQHAVEPIEERAARLPARPLHSPVAVGFLHGQLPCIAWAAAQTTPEARIGYVQTAGGALPGAHSRVVAELRARGLLADHVTAAPAFGGEQEAITVAGAIAAGVGALGWDGCIVGPGPGILGSASALGHGGLAALDSAHAALALGCRTTIVARMSSGDARERHRGVSHHTATVLQLLLAPVTVAVPAGGGVPELSGLAREHELVAGHVDLEGYQASGLPATTMGRSLAEDELFFRAALAGGSVFGAQVTAGTGAGAPGFEPPTGEER